MMPCYAFIEVGSDLPPDYAVRLLLKAPDEQRGSHGGVAYTRARTMHLDIARDVLLNIVRHVFGEAAAVALDGRGEICGAA